MPSKEIKEVHPKIIGIIKSYSCWYDKLSMTEGMGISGQPDVVFLFNGVFVGCEMKWDLRLKNGEVTKSKSKLPNPNQTKRLRDIKRSGGLAIVIDRNLYKEFETLMKLIEMGSKNLQQYIDLNDMDVEVYATNLKEMAL